MPSIQIDLPLTITAPAKQALAQRVGEIYAEIMQVGLDLLTVSVHRVAVPRSRAPNALGPHHV
jgi:phenylpyruvate tautomerase PptA (4-oxalocrotonate tautomerase family)